jgi:hypothetical protein
MFFELVGDIEEIELIAAGNSIRDIKRLRKQFGPGRWRRALGRSASSMVGYEQQRFTGTKRTALAK